MESKSSKKATLSTQSLEQSAAACHGIVVLIMELGRKINENKQKSGTSLSQRRAKQNVKWAEEIDGLKTIYPHWKNQFVSKLNEVDLSK